MSAVCIAHMLLGNAYPTNYKGYNENRGTSAKGIEQEIMINEKTFIIKAIKQTCLKNIK